MATNNNTSKSKTTNTDSNENTSKDENLLANFLQRKYMQWVREQARARDRPR